MRAANHPDRRCVPVEEWGPLDQALWHMALRAADPEEDISGLAMHWRPATIIFNWRGYGCWINFCWRCGYDMEAPPDDRVTPERVNSYLAELEQQGLALGTRRNRIAELVAVMSAFAPQRDWNWLRRVFNRLNAKLRRDRRRGPLTILAGDILGKSLKALDRLERDGQEWKRGAIVEHRNWLMTAMLTLTPLRRRNFAGLVIGRHLKEHGENFFLDIPGSETKTRKPIFMPVPDVLRRHIRCYIGAVRPRLLGDRDSDALWISRNGKPMNEDVVYETVVRFTEQALGVRVNPHRFRHIAATSAVIASPDHLDSVRALLTHGTTRTTEDYYVLGHSLAASRKHAELIEQLRSSLPGVKRERSGTT